MSYGFVNDILIEYNIYISSKWGRNKCEEDKDNASRHSHMYMS